MALVSGKLQMQHLAWRAGFGEKFPVVESWARKSRKQIVDNVLIGSDKDKSEPLMVLDKSDLPDPHKAIMTAEEKKMVQKMHIQGIKDLNVAWVNTMIESEHPLREKMALLWHGHFAARTTSVLFSQQLLQVIRDNALGNFGDLLTGVSKSPAMLQYLNNQQNRKAHPNENFAREVMELFTLGRGHYTENDVKEAARAFTGWTYDSNGNFEFRPKDHDTGEKTVLGKTGNFTGDDVLKILLEHEQTARFITAKIYRFFVDDVVDEQRVNALAHDFYTSGFNLKQLMRTIFMADWFYDQRFIGGHIKSPVELVVGLCRTLPIKFQRDEVILSFQQVMGQVLFYPPNVAGWPGGRSWIDSSTLMYRMQLPKKILNDQSSGDIKPKEITPEMVMTADAKVVKQDKTTMQVNDVLKKQVAKQIDATVDWQPYLKEYGKVTRENLANAIISSLLLTNKSVNKQVLESYADSTTRESYIKTVTIAVMGTPEYQMC
jgi:uncharacterized protein (DUF1800 family)